MNQETVEKNANDAESIKKPRHFDAVLGGHNSPPRHAAVLGGIEGAVMRLKAAKNTIDEYLEALESVVEYREKALVPLANILETEKNVNLAFWTNYYLVATIINLVQKEIDASKLPTTEVEAIVSIYQKIIDKNPLPYAKKEWEVDFVMAAIEIAVSKKIDVKLSRLFHIKNCLCMTYDKGLIRLLSLLKTSYQIAALHYPNQGTNYRFRIDPGRKYDRVVAEDLNAQTATAIGFVVKVENHLDFQQGDILKPKSWKSPSRTKRDNIFEIPLILCEGMWAGW